MYYFIFKTDLLSLRLAALDLSPEGRTYLLKDLKLENRHVSFSLLKRTDTNSDAADAIFSFKKV